MNKVKIVIYYNANQNQSILITNYIKKNIDVLKNLATFAFVNVDASNQHQLINRGITTIPSLSIGNKVISKCKTIIGYFENMKNTYNKSLDHPPEYNIETIAARDVEMARKRNGIHDGKIIFGDNNEDEDDSKVYLQKVAKFRQGQTDFNRGYEEKHKQLKNKGNVFSGEGGENSDEKFMKMSGFYNEIACEDQSKMDEDIHKYQFDSLMKPVYGNN